MKLKNLSGCFIAFFVLAGLVAWRLEAQTRYLTKEGITSSLLEKLAQNKRLDGADLRILSLSQPTPSIVTSLIAAFDRMQLEEDARAREAKEQVALTLIQIGVRDERYYKLLADHALEALEDTAPVAYPADSEGLQSAGHMSPEFLRWCQDQGKNPKTEGWKQLSSYMMDMWHLGESADPRAVAILKRGLEAVNPSIRFGSAYGLARLHDPSTFSIVVKACEKLHPTLASLMAKELAQYFTPEADAAMERFIKDPTAIEVAKRDAVDNRDRETERTLRWTAYWRTHQR